MIMIILLILNFINDSSDYSLKQRQNDTILIYEIYKDNIDFLKKCTIYEEWYRKYNEIESNNDLSCAKIRLKKYNKQKSYPPVRMYDKEGFGTAFEYPNIDIDTTVLFTILDLQTKFIVDSTNRRTKIPYNEKFFFSRKRRLMKIEKLVPTSLLPL